MSTAKQSRGVKLDPSMLQALMDSRGWNVEQLQEQTNDDLCINTIKKAQKGNGVDRSTALILAKAFGVTLNVLLAESTVKNWGVTVHEYLLSEVLTDWQTASNGLRFQICRLRHMELDRQARGKRFDLRDLATDDEQRCRTWIKRHPNVCGAFDGHPNIIRNLTAFHEPVESFYWVLDEWIDGEPLQRKLKAGAFTLEQARRLMLDMANGLAGLHEQGIIRRELQPASILIRNDDGRAVLTEFELAKLIDHGPTVSTADWPVDPYRAGEADGDDVDQRADIYSWARISTHALLGELPDISDEAEALQSLRLPKPLFEILSASLAPFRSERPASMADIIPILSKWK